MGSCGIKIFKLLGMNVNPERHYSYIPVYGGTIYNENGYCIYLYYTIQLCTRLYLTVCSLLTCGKHLNGRIISLKREAYAYRNSLTLLCYSSAWTKQGKCAVMFLCVRGIDFLRFLVEFLEMFRQCDMLCFSFYQNFKIKVVKILRNAAIN